MNPADLVLCVLSALDAPLDDPSHQVEALVQACEPQRSSTGQSAGLGHDPGGAGSNPDVASCVHVLAVLWSIESKFALYPSTRYAFGPVQVLFVKGLTPSAATMRDDPVEGLRAGWMIWNAKSSRLAGLFGRTPTYEAIARAYNGTAVRGASYGRRAAKLFRRTQRCR